MSERLSRAVRRGLPVVAIGLFALALLALRRELATHHYAEIIGHLRSLRSGTIAIAAGLTLAAYAVLTRYDALALQYVRRPVRPLQVALASFIAYSMSQTLGFALFTGGAIRYRFWSSWGLSAGEIARAVGFAGLTLWSGILGLVGSAMLVDPDTMAGLIGIHPMALRAIGSVLILTVVSYLGLALLRKRPVEVHGWRFEIPRPALAFEQVLVSCLDWALAAAVLFVLLPPGHGIGFPVFLGIFVLAQVAGLVSHVPGGLGVFDTLMVLALTSRASAAAVLGSLLAFRAIYYLAPFLFGSILLLGSEGFRQRTRFAGVARWAGRWLPGVIPLALATLTFAGGVVLLVSGATPAIPARLRWLGEILPLSIIEASHFAGSLAGMSLLILARGLSRRLDAAYFLTLTLLLVGVTASLLKGADYEEAVLLLAIFALVLPARRRFYRKAKLLAEPFSAEWIVLVLVVLVAVVAIGEFRFRHVSYTDELWWRFALHADAPRSLRATLGVVVLGAGYALLRLLRPSRPDPALPGRTELEQVARIVTMHGDPRANLALMGDKALLLSESGLGFVAYGVSGRCWIAMGDPVGPAAELAELAWAFRALADRHAAWTVFYEVSHQHLPLYVDLGLTLAKLGEAAKLALPEFSLDGSARAGLRRSLRHAERAGASFTVEPRESIPALLAELKEVSDQWLEAKGAREKGFSLGVFDPAYLSRFPHAVVREGGRIVAFANIWETATRHEVSMDLMRHGRDASERVMDYLFVNMFLWAKAAGYHWFDLGIAPLSGFQRRSLAPLWHRVGGMLFQHGERFYKFRGLRHFKEKFDPVWEPVYLASPGGLKLPRILASVAALVSSGWRVVKETA